MMAQMRLQFVIIVTLLAYSANHESPTMPGETEWRACERPLGAWNALWLVRVALGCLLAFWSWQKEREKRAMYAYVVAQKMNRVANSKTACVRKDARIATRKLRTSVTQMDGLPTLVEKMRQQGLQVARPVACQVIPTTAPAGESDPQVRVLRSPLPSLRFMLG